MRKMVMAVVWTGLVIGVVGCAPSGGCEVQYEYGLVCYEGYRSNDCWDSFGDAAIGWAEDGCAAIGDDYPESCGQDGEHEVYAGSAEICASFEGVDQSGL